MVVMINADAMQKRYEHYTAKGKEFTRWFDAVCDSTPKWQLEGKLRNEYRQDTGAPRVINT